jgi:hypothetical protein
MIEGEKDGPGCPVTLPVSLVARGSSAPPA